MSAFSGMALLGAASAPHHFAAQRGPSPDGGPHLAPPEQQRHYHGPGELNPLERLHCKRGVRRSALRELPQWFATDSDAGRECPACLENFEPGETVLLQLPCRHMYCKPCITQWLAQHHTCPLCRWEFALEHTRLRRADSGALSTRHTLA